MGHSSTVSRPARSVEHSFPDPNFSISFFLFLLQETKTMRNATVVVAVILITAVLCFAGDELQPTTRTVTGTRIGHYLNGPLPQDLSALTIAAFVPNGSGYTVINGTGTSSGTFTINNVPAGFYLLQIGNLYLWTSNNRVNADFISAYRNNVVAADYNGTFFTFDVTNLNPWQSTDMFEIACPNNLSFDLYPGTVGETTFTGTFNFFGNLSDASQGDQYYISQLITQNVGGYPFTALGHIIAPPKFTQAQDSDTTIRGRLTTIAQTNTFEANINGADLLAQALAANPKASLYASFIGLDVFP